MSQDRQLLSVQLQLAPVIVFLLPKHVAGNSVWVVLVLLVEKAEVDELVMTLVMQMRPNWPAPAGVKSGAKSQLS